MTYEELKSVIEDKKNSEGDFFSAYDLYTLATNAFTVIQNVLSDDMFISAMNYLHGYNRRYLKKICKIDGKKAPFISGVQYFTGSREEDNKLMFLIIMNGEKIDRRAWLEVYTKNDELSYKLHFDDYHNEKNDSYIVKYSEMFLKSFKKEIIERLDIIKSIKDTYCVTLNGFDVHAADKYQELNDGIFKVVFTPSANETDLNVEIGFNDDELNKVRDTQYLTKQTLVNYIKENKTEILSKIKVDEDELNNFYKKISSYAIKKQSNAKLNLHK